MGILSKIAKKAKEIVQKVGTAISTIYKTADKAVGGYLPGASTPTQVKAETAKAPMSIPKAATTTPITTTTKKPEKKGIIEKVANVALKPSVAIGNVITGGIEKITGQKYGRTTSEELAATPAGKVLGTGIAAAGTALAVVSGAELFAAAKTGIAAKAIAEAAAGKTIIRTTTNLATGRVSQVAINTVTAAKTTSFISKIASVAKNPAVITSTIIGAIGSYPFAGFIKEEALQTVSMGVGNAIRNGDIEGAEKAIELQKEILNPSIWQKIIASVPYANVLGSLKKFYESAANKLEVDSKEVQRMITEQKNTEDIKANEEADPNAKWDRIQKEQDMRRDKERAEDEAYYKKVEENKKKAEEQKRTDDAAYWDKILKEQEKKDEEKRKADNEYWKAVRKQKEENLPSKLKFGLL